MVTHEITFRILLTPLRLRLALLLALLCAFPRLAATGEVSTLTTYYPTPSATFGEMTVYKSAVLARDNDRTYIGAARDNDSTYVGVGDAPDKTNKLRVFGAGGILIKGCIGLNNTPTVTFRCRWEE